MALDSAYHTLLGNRCLLTKLQSKHPNIEDHGQKYAEQMECGVCQGDNQGFYQSTGDNVSGRMKRNPEEQILFWTHRISKAMAIDTPCFATRTPY